MRLVVVILFLSTLSFAKPINLKLIQDFTLYEPTVIATSNPYKLFVLKDVNMFLSLKEFNDEELLIYVYEINNIVQRSYDFKFSFSIQIPEAISKLYSDSSSYTYKTQSYLYNETFTGQPKETSFSLLKKKVYLENEKGDNRSQNCIKYYDVYYLYVSYDHDSFGILFMYEDKDNVFTVCK